MWECAGRSWLDWTSGQCVHTLVQWREHKSPLTSTDLRIKRIKQVAIQCAFRQKTPACVVVYWTAPQTNFPYEASLTKYKLDLRLKTRNHQKETVTASSLSQGGRLVSWLIIWWAPGRPGGSVGGAVAPSQWPRVQVRPAAPCCRSSPSSLTLFHVVSLSCPVTKSFEKATHKYLMASLSMKQNSKSSSELQDHSVEAHLRQCDE